ncbi:MAG TPA: hypothetical protein VKR53_06605 [Puia sp.]|nr:hypothetical protein [Puia sp.]
MKPRTFSAIGGWQSLMFCVGIYVVSLFFSIFICSSVFYVVNSNGTGSKANNVAKAVAAPKIDKHVLASVTK